jgi:hypothetical protein
MYWTELKRALLYGQPSITRGTLQPQTVKTAVRDIVRLISSGWIEELTEDALQRIQTACQMGQCPEIWEEFRGEEQVVHCCRKAGKMRLKPAKRNKHRSTARNN